MLEKALILFLILGFVSCSPREEKSNGMNTELETWERQFFTKAKGQAFVFYVLYGKFPEDLKISRSQYKTVGLPSGISIKKLRRDKQEPFPFTDGEFGKISLDEHPQLSQAIEDAPECIVIQGEIADSSTLNYLRDAIGVVTYFLDNGAVAALDPQQLQWYDRDAWRKQIFDLSPLDFRKHAVILCSEDSNNTKWFHTRGMRKFSRPDLSIHNVIKEQEKAVIELLNRFIAFQANGGSIEEGQEITMASLPVGMTCHHKGSFDDFDFNNIHVEIVWPSSSQ